MKEGLTLLLLTAAGPLSLFAQNIDIAEESVRRNKRDVEVRFELETTPKTLKNRYKTEVTPYLYAGTDTLRLPPVEVFGKIRYKRERQEQALAGNPRWALSSRQTMEGTPYRYFAAAPYERWMRTASLGIACRTIGCGCDCYDGDRVVAERIPVYVAPVPYLSDRPAEPEKFEVVDARKRWNFDREEIKVIFPVSKTELLLTEYGMHDNSLTKSGRHTASVRQKKLKYVKLPLFWRAFAFFVYRYFFRLGFLDGKEGFLWHFLQGWWYRTLADAKVYEIKKQYGFDSGKIRNYLETICMK